MEKNDDILLKVEHLKKYYPVKSSSLKRSNGFVKAVDDISFDVKVGETFGIVGELFSILKYEDQKNICNLYHLDVETFQIYLPILSNYRNLCAHEDILYENRTQKRIPNTIYHQLLNIPKEEEEYTCGKNDLFSLLIIMKQMLSEEEFKNLTIELAEKVFPIFSTINLTTRLNKSIF